MTTQSTNKTVVVTGGSRGLGLAIVHRLAAAGLRVVAVSRELRPELESLIAETDHEIEFFAYDFDDLAGIHTAAKQLLERHGPLYALVNNAAVGGDGILGTMHNKDIERLLRVNLTAPILWTKYLSRSMLLQRAGRIVNISSIIASTGFSGLSVYAATKAGLEGFTRSLARELGRADITVNAVAPGYMDTAMTQSLDDDKKQAIRRRSPLGRLAEPADVAGTVAYLLGPEASAITGAVLTVDAGSTA